MKNGIEFFEFVEELKCVKRFKSFEPMHESVAGHIFGAMFIAHDLMDRFDLGLDKTHVLELLLFHDLAEAGMKFDIEAPKSAENEDVKKQKHLAEMAKIEEISKKYKKPFVFELFKEFEEKKTKESLFANLVDKIDAQNHMIQNKCAGLATEADFDFIIHFSDKFIVHFPQLEMVEKEIQKRLKKYKNEFLKRK